MHVDETPPSSPRHGGPVFLYFCGLVLAAALASLSTAWYKSLQTTPDEAALKVRIERLETRETNLKESVKRWEQRRDAGGIILPGDYPIVRQDEDRRLVFIQVDHDEVALTADCLEQPLSQDKADLALVK